MTDYRSILDRLRRTHGTLFSEDLLAPKFKPYLFGPRIEVRTTYPDGTTHVRRGRVGITTGHLPVFILLPRRDSRSSSDILDDRDEILRVIPDWRDRVRISHHPRLVSR